MYKTGATGSALVRELAPLVAETTGVEVVVCPPFTALGPVGEALRGTAIRLGAQNVHWEREGAFTGEIAAPMLVELGVHYVIVGHSERRQYFGETDESVNRRARAALAAGLRPIVCVGETLAQREAGQTLKVVTGQVEAALAGMTADEMVRVVLAYEPVWAIGTGRTATPPQAQEVHELIRRIVERLFGASAAQRVVIQYGGSVKSDNARDLLQQPDVDGALVGGASLKAADFAAIVRAAM